MRRAESRDAVRRRGRQQTPTNCPSWSIWRCGAIPPRARHGRRRALRQRRSAAPRSPYYPQASLQSDAGYQRFMFQDQFAEAVIKQWEYTPLLQLTYILIDFGRRSAIRRRRPPTTRGGQLRFQPQNSGGRLRHPKGLLRPVGRQGRRRSRAQERRADQNRRRGGQPARSTSAWPPSPRCCWPGSATPSPVTTWKTPSCWCTMRRRISRWLWGSPQTLRSTCRISDNQPIPPKLDATVDQSDRPRGQAAPRPRRAGGRAAPT